MRRFTLVTAITASSLIWCAGARATTPLALGTYVPGIAVDRGCPTGYSCQRFDVTCPQLPKLGGVLARGTPYVTPRGMAVFLVGSGGTDLWAPAPGTPQWNMMESLRGAGIDVVQIKWNSGYTGAAAGSLAGPVAVTCRPATAFQWVHDNLYLPLGITSDGTHCGFCLVGSSGGASAIAYATTRYGLTPDALIAVSGPMHYEIDRGCLPTYTGYYYSSSDSRVEIDSSYGFKKTGGPCQTADATWAPRWQQDGIEGADLYMPFRVEVLIGAADATGAIPHAADFATGVSAAGSPNVHYTVLSGLGHGLRGSVKGCDAVQAAILQ